MLEPLRRPARRVIVIVSLVRQYARRFEVVDEQLRAQTVGGYERVRFIIAGFRVRGVLGQQLLLRIVAVVARGGGGGRAGVGTGGVGGVDGHVGERAEGVICRGVACGLQLVMYASVLVFDA